jgi:hypothetical protein
VFLNQACAESSPRYNNSSPDIAIEYLSVTVALSLVEPITSIIHSSTQPLNQESMATETLTKTVEAALPLAVSQDATDKTTKPTTNGTTNGTAEPSDKFSKTAGQDVGFLSPPRLTCQSFPWRIRE